MEHILQKIFNQEVIKKIINKIKNFYMMKIF